MGGPRSRSYDHVTDHVLSIKSVRSNEGSLGLGILYQLLLAIYQILRAD